MPRRSFGIIDRLKSGNYRARYTGPDGRRYTAPATSKTIGPLTLWLAKQQTLIATGAWVAPDVASAKAVDAAALRATRDVALGPYAASWIRTRTNSRGETLSPRTSAEYSRLLALCMPDLTPMRIIDVTPVVVRTWRAEQMSRGTATQTARAYALLSSIMRTAVEDGIIATTPCTIKGGSKSSTGQAVLPPTDDEYEAVLAALPKQYRALAVIAASSGLRWGEITSLTGRDVRVERDAGGAVQAVRLTVNKGVVRARGQMILQGPKTVTSNRTVAVYGREADVIAEHVGSLKTSTELLFHAVKDPTEHLPHGTFQNAWRGARDAAGRPDLRLHALRHYAGTRYAQTGATMKETMARLGHSTSAAAMRYQHAGTRDDELAQRMAR